MSKIHTSIVTSFEDPRIDRSIWNSLLSRGVTNNLELTWQYQRLWWQQNSGRGELLLVIAETDGEVFAIAPMFFTSGMILNLCPICSLDVIGNISDQEVIDSMLMTAMGSVAEFVGFCFYFIPKSSRTSLYLQEAAARLGLRFLVEDEQPSPIINISKYPDEARACTKKTMMIRRENKLRREGELKIHHYTKYFEIEQQLDAFFDQHIARWSNTSTPSKFLDNQERENYQDRMRELADSGWLRFSSLEWKGIPIAFHQGSCYARHYTYGRTTFSPELSDYSPGTVLLRHVLLSAIEEDAEVFDFGFGAEDYKYRYANEEVKLKTIGLYR